MFDVFYAMFDSLIPTIPFILALYILFDLIGSLLFQKDKDK